MHKFKLLENIDMKLVTVVILAISIVALAFSAPFAYAAYHRTVQRVVVIDAGHGGIDGGVVGVKTGVKESELNLKIAKIVGEYLAANGFMVVQTRANADGLYSDFITTSKKRNDMENRAKLINKSGAACVVSIHMNSYSSPSRRGAQVFFNKKNTQSKVFGETMQERVNCDLNTAINREYAALSAEKFILECTKAPVIIVECGFLSNPLDEANLINPDYQMKLGYSIFQGIAIYLSNMS